MDRRGRLAQPLTWIAHRRTRVQTRFSRLFGPTAALLLPLALWTHEVFARIVRTRVPRGAGLAGTVLIVIASLSYGVIKGDRLPGIVEALKDARDQAANAAGFRIVSISVSGNAHVSREEILRIVGVTTRTSLLFLDVEDAREQLKTNPWIAEATVLKLYPGDLRIGITEREPFAIWQRQGEFFAIAADGTVLEPYAASRLVQLPLIVGRGADKAAKEFLTVLGRFPEIRDQVRASVLVGERRWNLRLRNGLDVRLPEVGPAAALERLAALDRDVKLISRDITAIDLRLADRVTVQLSPVAAQARADALKKKSITKKGDSA
ncbi:MAG TPA: cell division protein FtsQ/DivIB [Xanthobacteraceae bacterium]|jgi:cell division protein FtsQ